MDIFKVLALSRLGDGTVGWPRHQGVSSCSRATYRPPAKVSQYGVCRATTMTVNVCPKSSDRPQHSFHMWQRSGAVGLHAPGTIIWTSTPADFGLVWVGINVVFVVVFVVTMRAVFVCR